MMGDISVISGEYLVESYKASGSGFEMSLMAKPEKHLAPWRITVSGPVKPLLHAPIPSRVRVTVGDVFQVEEVKPVEQPATGKRKPWVKRLPTGAVGWERLHGMVMMHWEARELLEDLAEALKPLAASESVEEQAREAAYERPLVGVASNGSISVHLRPGKVHIMPLAKAQDLYSDLAAALRETAGEGRSAFGAAVILAPAPVPEWLLIQARGRRDWDRHKRSVEALVQIYGTVSQIPGSLERALNGRMEVLTEIYGPEPHCRMPGDSGGLDLLADKIVADEGKR